MKSRTKNYLTKEQITELVRVNFGDACQIGEIKELKGGMFNSAYLIERPLSQDQIVLKVSVRPGTKTLTYEADPMPTEVSVFQMIAEHTSIPTPRILAADLSKTKIPSNYFFMTALEGVSLHEVHKKITKENLLELKTELAGYLGELHQIQGHYFGYFTENPEKQYSSWKEAFSSMMTDVLNDAKRNGTRLPYERYETVMQEKMDYLDVVEQASLIDYDLWAGNVFVKQQGERYVIEGIIDFERAFWGDPLSEFAGSVMLMDRIFEEQEIWNTYQKQSGTQQESIMESTMESTNEITNEIKVRHAFYQLYIYTIMAAETFRYGAFYRRMQTSFALKQIKRCLTELETADKMRR